ncbi:MAG: alkene reductase [Planctomycetota bacterium]
MSAPANPLLSPVSMGDFRAPNRVFMAPLTRSRSKQPGDIPWEMNAEYYAQRAPSGLIIAEATQVSPQGKGYAYTPGIHSEEQVAGWRLVTDAVHAAGGRIALQLWHVGRISHVDLQPDGQRPVAPTSARAKSKTYTSHESGMLDVSEPRALETSEVPGIVEQFRHGAEMAKAAGFDGVEIHGANGYLLDQFTRDGVNTRDDEWGGSVDNRTRLGVEVAEAVVGVWGEGRVGYRVSPYNTFNDLEDSDPRTTFVRLSERLGGLGLAFLHVVERPIDGSEPTPEAAAGLVEIRDAFKGSGGSGYVANCGYTPESGAEAIASGHADAIAYGKLFISNPDLPERLRRGGPFAEWNRDTFYGGTHEGYTDQPALSEPVWNP